MNNTPQLRFPGFTGEWITRNVEELCDTITAPRKLQSQEYLSFGQYPIVDQSQSMVCGRTNDTSTLVNIDKPVIIFGDHTCVLKYIDFPFAQGADGVKILLPKEEYIPNFIYQALASNPVKQDGYKRHFSDLKEKIYCVPVSPSEQQKIADCLSALDDLISAQGEKVDALKTRKKGLIQQLIPQNGETTPRLRFPGFTGEWSEKKLGDSFEERTEKNRGDLPLLSLGENGLVLQSETDRKDNSNADKSKYLRVAIGDIAYNTMRMWQGRCVIAKIEGIVSPAYTVCKPMEDVVSLFHYYLFKTDQMIHLFHQNSQGLVSDTLNLKYEAFAKIKYYLPSPAEQQKIADCLSALDDLIASESAELEALKAHKKGLMQQLFPEPAK